MSDAPVLLPTAPPDGATRGVRPRTARDLVRAWKKAHKVARHLGRKLKALGQRTRRYHARLVLLARATKKRKAQNLRLRARLLAFLDRKAPPEPSAEEQEIWTKLDQLQAEDKQVPAQWARLLLKRLAESQKMLGEFETLLAFRENQVHELLERPPANDPGRADRRLLRAHKELAQTRHRVRLLTMELMHSEGPRLQELSDQVARLERELESRPQASQLAHSQEQLELAQIQVTKLEEVMQTRVAELQKAATTLGTAKARLAELEQELARLQGENEQLKLDHEKLKAERQTLATEKKSLQERYKVLQSDYEALEEIIGSEAPAAAPEADPRVPKLEAAVQDLKAKLQLAASKYNEVKELALGKQAQLIELQKKNDFMVPLVQTLETALDEARVQANRSQELLEKEKARSVELEARAPSGGAGDDERVEELENKLRESRRAVVRAQAEAGVKRREAARLESEVADLKASLEQTTTRMGKLEELARAQARKLKEQA